MHTAVTRALILAWLCSTPVLLGGCSSGSSDDSSTPELGMTAIVLRDGTVQTSDGREVTQLFVQISRITIELGHDHVDGGHSDGNSGDDDGDGDDGDDGDDDDLASTAADNAGDRVSAANVGKNVQDANDNADDDRDDDGDDDDDDDDGNDDGDGDDDDDDDNKDGEHDDGEVVVFDMNRDNGGQPRVIDLLTLSDSGVLFNMLAIPVGTYEEASVELVGASAIFADDPTQTPVQLALAGDDGAEFEFEFDPPVVVTKDHASVATIDFVPVITLGPSGYTLSHDDDTDASGECGDGELEIEVEGTVSSKHGNLIELGQFNLEVDLSALGPVDVAVGDHVEVDGVFADGVLMAHSIEHDD